MLSTAILAPLDVIVTRLAIQRNYGGSPVETGSPESGAEDEQVVDLEKATPEVVLLPSEAEEVVVRYVLCTSRVVDI